MTRHLGPHCLLLRRLKSVPHCIHHPKSVSILLYTLDTNTITNKGHRQANVFPQTLVPHIKSVTHCIHHSLPHFFQITTLYHTSHKSMRRISNTSKVLLLTLEHQYMDRNQFIGWEKSRITNSNANTDTNLIQIKTYMQTLPLEIRILCMRSMLWVLSNQLDTNIYINQIQIKIKSTTPSKWCPWHNRINTEPV